MWQYDFKYKNNLNKNFILKIITIVNIGYKRGVKKDIKKILLWCS